MPVISLPDAGDFSLAARQTRCNVLSPGLAAADLRTRKGAHRDVVAGHYEPSLQAGPSRVARRCSRAPTVIDPFVAGVHRLEHVHKLRRIRHSPMSDAIRTPTRSSSSRNRGLRDFALPSMFDGRVSRRDDQRTAGAATRRRSSMVIDAAFVGRGCAAATSNSEAWSFYLSAESAADQDIAARLHRGREEIHHAWRKCSVTDQVFQLQRL